MEANTEENIQEDTRPLLTFTHPYRFQGIGARIDYPILQSLLTTSDNKIVCGARSSVCNVPLCIFNGYTGELDKKIDDWVNAVNLYALPDGNIIGIGFFKEDKTLCSQIKLLNVKTGVAETILEIRSEQLRWKNLIWMSKERIAFIEEKDDKSLDDSLIIYNLLTKRIDSRYDGEFDIITKFNEDTILFCRRVENPNTNKNNETIIRYGEPHGIFTMDIKTGLIRDTKLKQPHRICDLLVLPGLVCSACEGEDYGEGEDFKNLLVFDTDFTLLAEIDSKGFHNKMVNLSNGRIVLGEFGLDYIQRSIYIVKLSQNMKGELDIQYEQLIRKASQGNIMALAAFSDGRVVSGDSDGEIYVWDTNERKRKTARNLQQLRRLGVEKGIPNNVEGLIGHFHTGVLPKKNTTTSIKNLRNSIQRNTLAKPNKGGKFKTTRKTKKFY
jgi:hypothetical protein